MKDKGLSREECNLLRGVAALFVVTAHYCQWYAVRADAGIFCMLLSKLGRYGVSIFFALSGYGLMCSVKKGIDKSFLVRRVKNVYVPYLIITGLIHILDGTKWNLKIAVRWILAMDSWFVLVIIIFYMLFYFVWKYCKNKIAMLQLGILVISIAIGICTKDSTWYSCNFAFGIGILIKAYEAGFVGSIQKNKWKWFSVVAVSFAVSAVIYMAAMSRNQIVYIVFKIAASVFWTFLVLGFGELVRLEFAKPVRVLGEASLECYLIHPFIISLFGKRMDFLEDAVILLISVVVSVAAACMIHNFYGFLLLKIKRKHT